MIELEVTAKDIKVNYIYININLCLLDLKNNYHIKTV